MRFHPLGYDTGASSSCPPHPHPDRGVLLRAELEQLRRDVAAHSRICMAEGAVAALGPLPVEDAAAVLREVARTLDLDVHRVAEHVLGLVQGARTPAAVRETLQQALHRTS